MSNYIEYNDGKLLSIDNIRRLDRMSDEDRAQMSESLGIDASGFHTRILLSTGRDKRARESIEELATQMAMVDIGADRWIVAKNIIEVVPFTEKQAAKAKARGSKFNHVFHSAVETVAGRVLSLATTEEIMRRKAVALRQSGPRVAIS